MVTVIIQDGYGKDFSYNVKDYNGIYQRIMALTEDNHEESANVASWCEIASVGERYLGDGFTVDICK